MSSTSSGLTSAMVRAGAGAGKTRGLVEKVVDVFRHFQKRGETPRLVLTTFTRKATQELKERLILKACSDRDPALLQFVSDPSKMHISTIHGLLNVFLRQVGHLAGLDAGFRIVSEAQANHMARLSLREVLVSETEYLRWLEVYGFERLLSMCRLYEAAARQTENVRPASISDLEEVAAREASQWREWLGELSAQIQNEVDDSAWQEFAGALRNFLVSWNGDGTALSEMPSKPRRSKKQMQWEAWHDRVDEALKEFKRSMARDCWNQSLWPAMVQAWQEFAPLAEEFRQRLSQTKEQQASFEMADLELKALEILREKPFLGTVFAESWDFWMIDEYQDTSPLQVAVLNALIGDRPKFCVGDPQQSIYLFRGADVGVFESTLNEIQQNAGEVLELRRNYRSRPEVLLFINDFMAAINSSAFQAMEPRSDEVDQDRVCAWIVRATDHTAEMQALVSRVRQLVEQGTSLEQICVLGRTHRNLMDVSRVLKAEGFATHVHSSRGFNERREVQDARALWRFLINPHDNLGLLQLLRSPWFYVDDWRLAEWMKDRPASLWRRLQVLDKLPESVQRLKEMTQRLPELGLVHSFEEALMAAAFLDLSLYNDPAGRKESNLWKLIFKARTLEKEGGASVLEFLDSTSADPLESSEGDATSAQEPNCINLMTIHGAKGLEFDHVLLPCMSDSPRTSVQEPLTMDSEGRFFFPLWNENEGSFIGSPLDFISVRARRKCELEEFDRWLYVALTRARQSLTLTGVREAGRDSWMERSPWFQKSVGEYTQQGYRYAVVEEIPVSQNQAVVSANLPPVVRSLWHKPQPTSLSSDRRSVTDLVQVPRESTTSREMIRRFEAQALGTRIHKAFELLKYGHARPPEFEQAIEFVLSLQDPPMRELIFSGHSEWGFQVQAGARVIEGQIDLWGKHQGQIFVVDYKSGSPKQKEQAFAQLSLYAWALRRFGHREAIVMIVVYPLSQKVERRDFSDELLAHWELEFAGAQTASQNDGAAASFDGVHRHVEGESVHGAKTITMREENL